MRINNENYPFNFWNTEWLPFCSEYLVKDSEILNNICKKMNYDNGKLILGNNSTNQKVDRCFDADYSIRVKKDGFTAKIKCQGGPNSRNISCKSKFIIKIFRIVL